MWHLGKLLMLFSAAFFIPEFAGVLGMADGEGTAYFDSINYFLRIYLTSAAITFVSGLIFWYLGTKKSPKDRELLDREGFAVVGLAWLLVAAFGSLPYIFSGALSPLDAYFESMSGFTTTGATVLSGSDPKGYYPLPKSLLLWRSFTQWLGGMGIVVLTIVILSRFMGSSIQLLKVELPGLTMTRLTPKIAQTAAIFWRIYALFTLIEITLLRISGMPLYDAFGNSFTTLSSGGFSPRALNIEYYDNVIYDSIFIVFMVIAGTNFVLHYHALHGEWRKLVNDTEFRTYIGIMFITSLIITVKLSIDSFYSPLSSFRYALFQVVSLNTATGYSNIGYGTWPESTRFLLLILMIIGGSAGSTSGGLKVIRLIVLTKLARREISRAIHPQREMPISIGGRNLSENLVQAVSVYFFIYLAILAIASAIIMFAGENLMDSVSSVATAMGGVGPPVGTKGPRFSFLDMNPVSKIVLILCMWLGRIEILAGFILFAPWSYKE